MTFAEILALILAAAAIFGFVVSYREILRSKTEIEKKRRQVDHQLFEVLTLREISEKIGYELNIDKILEIILTSLNKLVPYTAASFMVLRDNSKVVFRVNLLDRAGRELVNEVRDRMLTVLNGQTKSNFEPSDLEEVIDGNTLDGSTTGKSSSFWITPLVINGRGVGVLAIASYQSGLYTGEEMTVLGQILDQANGAVNKLEKLLKSEKGKLGALIFSLIDAILMFDDKQNLVVANPAAQKLLGIVPSDSTTIAEIAQALADKIDIRTKFEESVRGDRMVLYEDLMIKDRFFRLVVTPVKNDFGQVLGGVILFHDTTPGKELERLREDFTAMMVHELRAPLTVVRGTADMFLADANLAVKSEGRELLVSMHGSADTMLSLVNDLLDVAKIDAGKFQVDKSMENICDIVREKVLAFTALAKSRDVTVSYETVSQCPQFLFDRLRISQVISNLLSNAVKFTPSGGKVSVKVRMEDGDSAVRIDITDTGEGISPEKLKDLFSKFKQLGANKEGGSGLGLVIAKGIVEAHAGQLLVQSQVGVGSTFTVILPVTS